MTEPDFILPMALADAKPWYTSLTIKTSLGQVILGLVVVVLAVAGVVPEEWAAFGLSQIGLGIAAVQGRARAEQPIRR